jgi:hypothetical protein
MVDTHLVATLPLLLLMVVDTQLAAMAVPREAMAVVVTQHLPMLVMVDTLLVDTAAAMEDTHLAATRLLLQHMVDTPLAVMVV